MKSMTNSKTYIIIVDGGADRPIKELNYKTPFEYADTPNLNFLAKQGVQGGLYILNEELPPESDNGIMALLSYDPLKFYTGRGPLEGLGLDFLQSDRNTVSFRINFANYNENKKLLERRTARDLTDDELQFLAKEIKKNVSISTFKDITYNIHAFDKHRGIFTIISENTPINGRVSNTDPGFKKVGYFGIPTQAPYLTPLKCHPLDNSEGAINISKIVNEFIEKSNLILRNSVINKERLKKGQLSSNMILFRDSGDNPKPLMSFYDKFNRHLSFYGLMPAEKGLMSLLDGKFQYCKQKNEDDLSYLKRAAGLLINDSADVVGIHLLKKVDEAGHGNEPHTKVSLIEKLDKFFISELIKNLKDDDMVIITCDHATPCELKIHSNDIVPVSIYSKNIIPDSTQEFGESISTKGSLNVKYAKDLLPFVFKELIYEKY